MKSLLLRPAFLAELYIAALLYYIKYAFFFHECGISFVLCRIIPLPLYPFIQNFIPYYTSFDALWYTVRVFTTNNIESLLPEYEPNPEYSYKRQ